MSLRAWLRVGWLVLAADAVYWRFGVGPLDDNEQPISHWHGVLNAVTWYGGGIVFLVVLILHWIRWRENEPERARSQGPF